MGRKSKANLGAVDAKLVAPPIETVSDSVTMPERLLKRLLESSVEVLASDRDLCVTYFSHFFDASISVAERNVFVDHFIANTPQVKHGYPRSGVEFPAINVLVLEDQQSEGFAAQHLRDATEEDTDAARYVGGFWDSMYGILVMAEHPDQGLYLYNMCKAILVSGNEWLLGKGVVEVLPMVGTDLTPDKDYQSTNMFNRMLRVPLKVQTSVPRFYAVDPKDTRLAGLYRSDVVVDGIRGGVTSTGESDE